MGTEDGTLASPPHPQPTAPSLGAPQTGDAGAQAVVPSACLSFSPVGKLRHKSSPRGGYGGSPDTGVPGLELPPPTPAHQSPHRHRVPTPSLRGARCPDHPCGTSGPRAISPPPLPAVGSPRQAPRAGPTHVEVGVGDGDGGLQPQGDVGQGRGRVEAELAGAVQGEGSVLGQELLRGWGGGGRTRHRHAVNTHTRVPRHAELRCWEHTLAARARARVCSWTRTRWLHLLEHVCAPQCVHAGCTHLSTRAHAKHAPTSCTYLSTRVHPEHAHIAHARSLSTLASRACAP